MITLIIVLIMYHSSTVGFISLFSSQKQKLWQRQEEETVGTEMLGYAGKVLFPLFPLALGTAEDPKKIPELPLCLHSFPRGERKTLQGIPEWFGLEETFKNKKETNKSETSQSK